jgi:hypothetical protein
VIAIINKMLVCWAISIFVLFGLQYLFQDDDLIYALYMTWCLWGGWVFVPWLDKNWSSK